MVVEHFTEESIDPHEDILSENSLNQEFKAPRSALGNTLLSLLRINITEFVPNEGNVFLVWLEGPVLLVDNIKISLTS